MKLLTLSGETIFLYNLVITHNHSQSVFKLSFNIIIYYFRFEIETKLPIPNPLKSGRPRHTADRGASESSGDFFFSRTRWSCSRLYTHHGHRAVRR